MHVWLLARGFLSGMPVCVCTFSLPPCDPPSWIQCCFTRLNDDVRLVVHAQPGTVPVWDVALASSRSDPFVASVLFDRAMIDSCTPADLVYHRMLGSGSNGVVYEAGLNPLSHRGDADPRFAAKFVYNFGVTTSKVCACF